MQDRIIVYK